MDIHTDETSESKHSDFRSGFVAIIGRPNVGKSTLINALVTTNVVITSSKPETTRRVVRGIVNEDDAQIILVDTPGIHKPKTLLGKHLNSMTQDAMQDVDVVVFCTPANEQTGAGDIRITKSIQRMFGNKTPIIGLITKIDLVSKNEVFARLSSISSLYDFDELIPVSKESEEQLQILKHEIKKYLPLGPKLYPDDMKTDIDDETLISELVRESALEGLYDELSHSLNVMVTEIDDEESVLKIYVSLIVERDSQKPIIIGKKGSNIKKIGEESRKKLEVLFAKKVFLSTNVVVHKNWQNDAKELSKIGL
jgi:GTP-binding protein Era